MAALNPVTLVYNGALVSSSNPLPVTGAGGVGLATLGANTFTGAQTLTQGTITADAPQLNGTVTWNNAGVTFNAWKLNVTDSASNAASLLMDLQVGGTSKFKVIKDGSLTAVGTLTAATMVANGGYFMAGGGSRLDLTGDGFINGTANNVNNSALFRSGGNTALTAGGNLAMGFTASSVTAFGVFYGSGAPTISAAKGSQYLRSDGSGVNDRSYIATNSSGTWTALVTVA